jgi:hypothetical protein
MATRTNASGEFAIHNIALVAGAEDRVNFGDDFDTVEVTVVSGTDPLYFTVDGTASDCGRQEHLQGAGRSRRVLCRWKCQPPVTRW